MNIVFFRRPKPKQFKYIPRYYDPEQEELNERKRQLGLLDETDIREKMRSDIRRKWRVERTPTSKHMFYVRVAMYVAVIAFALYFIFFSDVINKLVSFFIK